MLKKLILAISGLGVLAMLFVSVDFYIEKNKAALPSRQSAGNEIKTAFQPAENQDQKQTREQTKEQDAPSIAPNTMLPENIPPAMLKAMQEKGMTIEDLQQKQGANKEMPAMGNMPKGKAFPEAMLKAIEEQKKEQVQNQTQGQTQGQAQEQVQEMSDPVLKAVNHIKSHADEASIKHLEHSLAALQENPADEKALAAVTELFLTHNEIEGAEVLLQKGIVSAPNNAMLPFFYGQVLLAPENPRYEKAAEQWERALFLQDSAELHYSLGMLYRYQLDKENLAKEHFQKAKTLPQHDPKLADHLSIELEK